MSVNISVGICPRINISLNVYVCRNIYLFFAYIDVAIVLRILRLKKSPYVEVRIADAYISERA